MKNLIKINPVRFIKISGTAARVLSLFYILNLLLSLGLVFTSQAQQALESNDNKVVFVANILSNIIMNGLYVVVFYGYSKLIEVFTLSKENKDEKGS